MKKQKVLGVLAAVLCAAMLPMAAYADGVTDGEETQIEENSSVAVVTTAAALQEAMNANSPYSVVKLGEDIDMATGYITVRKKVTLDLNGHNLTSSDSTRTVSINSGIDLTITDTSANKKGVLSNTGAGTVIYSMMGGSVTIEAGTITAVSEKYGAILCSYWGPKKFNLTINGGTISGHYYAVAGNGQDKNVEITVNGGELYADCAGMYLPLQNSTTTINGGKIVGGESGIELRASELIVNGGTIMSEFDSQTVKTDPNGSGTTITGAGIAVSQHTTKQDTKLVINGGNISGVVPVYEANVMNNSPEDIAKVSIEINDGEFNVTTGGDKSVYSGSNVMTVKGGTFDVAPSAEYIAEGYNVVENADGTLDVAKPVEVAVNTDAISSGVDSDEVLDKYGFEYDKEMSVRCDEITLTGVDAKTKGISIDYAYDNKTFSKSFNFGAEISADGDVKVGVLLYNIPELDKLAVPAVTINR